MSESARRLRVTDLDDETSVEVEPPPARPASDVAAELGPIAAPASVVAEPPVPTVAVPLPPGRARKDRAPAYEVVAGGWRFRFAVEDAHQARLRDRARRAAAEHGPALPQTVKAQIPGRIVSVGVVPGDQVVVGQRLLAVEAMKMENEVRAPRAGTVEAVLVTAGARVELGDELVRIV
jgi:biotin carboxyl carrier protein